MTSFSLSSNLGVPIRIPIPMCGTWKAIHTQRFKWKELNCVPLRKISISTLHPISAEHRVSLPPINRQHSCDREFPLSVNRTVTITLMMTFVESWTKEKCEGVRKNAVNFPHFSLSLSLFPLRKIKISLYKNNQRHNRKAPIYISHSPFFVLLFLFLFLSLSTRSGEMSGIQSEENVSIELLSKKLHDFNTERGWLPHHSPRNLLLALVGEMGELSEIFQWKGEVERGVPGWKEEEKLHLGEELSDVLLYLIQLSDSCGVDLGAAALRKLHLNSLKYPPPPPPSDSNNSN